MAFAQAPSRRPAPVVTRRRESVRVRKRTLNPRENIGWDSAPESRSCFARRFRGAGDERLDRDSRPAGWLPDQRDLPVRLPVSRASKRNFAHSARLCCMMGRERTTSCCSRLSHSSRPQSRSSCSCGRCSFNARRGSARLQGIQEADRSGDLDFPRRCGLRRGLRRRQAALDLVDVAVAIEPSLRVDRPALARPGDRLDASNPEAAGKGWIASSPFGLPAISDRST